MPARTVIAATAFELGLLLAGVFLLWRLFLRPGARTERPEAQLPRWEIPPVEFARFILLVVCCTLGANLIGSLMLHWRPVGADAKAIFLTACAHAGMIGGIVAFKFETGRLRLDAAWLRPFDFASGVITFVIAMPLVTLVNLAWRGLLQLCGLPLDKQDLVGMFTNVRSPALLALMIGLAIVTAPLTEEMIFRGGFFRFMRTRVPRWAVLLGPALLFAGLHQNLASFGPLVALGVVFALAYEQTGRIGTTIVAHALFNLHTLALILAGVAE